MTDSSLINMSLISISKIHKGQGLGEIFSIEEKLFCDVKGASGEMSQCAGVVSIFI